MAIEDHLGTFRLTELDPPQGHRARTFVGILTKAVVPTAGYGGWSRVARPQKGALTEWVGRDALSVEVEFLVDNFGSGDNIPGTLDQDQNAEVETAAQVLDELAGVEAGDPEPPLLKVLGNPTGIIPHDYSRASQNKWFIETLSWDKDLARYNNDGNRTRCGGTMVLTVYRADDRLSRRAARGKSSKGSKKKTYTVKKGDSLRKIAARKDIYGDASKWKKIATANKIRDPKHLRIGQKLKIP
jgi:nucleoid-associated protein YgaU